MNYTTRHYLHHLAEVGIATKGTAAAEALLTEPVLPSGWQEAQQTEKADIVELLRAGKIGPATAAERMAANTAKSSPEFMRAVSLASELRTHDAMALLKADGGAIGKALKVKISAVEKAIAEESDVLRKRGIMRLAEAFQLGKETAGAWAGREAAKEELERLCTLRADLVAAGIVKGDQEPARPTAAERRTKATAGIL